MAARFGLICQVPRTFEVQHDWNYRRRSTKALSGSPMAAFFRIYLLGGAQVLNDSLAFVTDTGLFILLNYCSVDCVRVSVDNHRSLLDYRARSQLAGNLGTALRSYLAEQLRLFAQNWTRR